MREWYEHKKAFGGDPSKAKPYYDNPLYVAQHKLDGVRYHIYSNTRGDVKIYSRATSAITGEPVEKTEVLSHLARESRTMFGHGFVLDGELVAPKGSRTTFKDVTRISGSTAERAWAIQEREGYLRFAVFDVLCWDGQELINESNERRLELLYNFLPLENEFTYIFALNTAYSTEAKCVMREEVLASAGEGLILKNLQSVYNPKRNKDWIKDKFVQHVDVVFMGIEMGRETSIKKGDTEATPTRVAGLAGAIRFGQYVPIDGSVFAGEWEERGCKQIDGKLYELKEIGRTSGFNDEMRMDLTLNEKQYIGRVFTVRCEMQYTDTYALREPRFECWRDDKNAEDCIALN